MHTCQKRFVEIGLMGAFRFRKQPFTGKPVLQVRVIIGLAQYPNEPAQPHHREWRDATMKDAQWLMEETSPREPRFYENYPCVSL